MIVGKVGSPADARRVTPRPGSATSFAVAPSADPAAGPSPVTTPVPLDAMLALQEQQQEVDRAKDRQAHQHGQALLQALAAVQHAMLDGDPTAALQHLANLAGRSPAAADPALAAILQALALRANVELARRGL